jgi:hypothetical protein
MQQVLDSADLVESVVTGVVPVPAGIAEDNALQLKRADPKTAPAPKERPASQGQETTTMVKPEPKAEPKPEVKAEPESKQPPTPDPDDIEGDDGLTPRQKREYTEQMQKTIGKKHRKQMEAEEFALAQYNEKTLAEQRAEQLERDIARLKAQIPAAPAPVVAEAKAPDRKDFETDQAFQDAVIDYRVDQKLKAAQAEQAKRQEEARQQEIVATAAARIERAIELVPDFKAVTEAADTMVPFAVAGYMGGSPMIAELGYHFAKHPEVLAEIAKLNPYEQLVAVGEIKSTLRPFAPAAKANGEEPSPKPNGAQPSTETGTAPSKPRVSAPVIRPLNTQSGAQVEKDEADKTQSEIIADYQRRHGVKFSARKRH